MLMKIRNIVVCVVGLLLTACGAIPSQTEGGPTPNSFNLEISDGAASVVKEVDCWFEVSPLWGTASCGQLIVPEDYAGSTNNRVILPYVILGTISEEAPAPLLITGGGGPGVELGISPEDSSFIKEGYWEVFYRSAFSVDRALILIDNRGVGSSQPNLNCESVEAISIAQLSQFPEEIDQLQQYKDAFSSCRDKLVNDGVEIEHYNVINAARDINELRKQLNINTLNLYGVSYGTRVALMHERLFPETTRSMILDGVYPLFVRPYEDLSKDFYTGLDRVFILCEQDETCRSKLGHELREDFQGFLSRLEKSPLHLTITHPVTFLPVDVIVTPSHLISALFGSLYSTYGIEGLPLQIRSILAGNIDHLSTLIRYNLIHTLTVSSGDEGAYASYACHDEIPFMNVIKEKKLADTYSMQPHVTRNVIDFVTQNSIDFQLGMCEVWKVPAAQSQLKVPVEIKTPMLLYSGALDHVTPSRWAEQLKEKGTVAWNRTWKGISHGVMDAFWCADDVARDFLEAPYLNPFVSECLEEDIEVKFRLY